MSEYWLRIRIIIFAVDSLNLLKLSFLILLKISFILITYLAVGVAESKLIVNPSS